MKNVRQLLVRKLLKENSLQRLFDFKSEHIRYKGETIQCMNMKQWSELMVKDGAWGDSTVIQIFSEISGLTIHVIPTEFLTVQTVTHHAPANNYMDEAGITIVHGFGHFQVVVPTKYPSSIEVEKVEAIYTGEFIKVESESESSLANRKKRAKKKRKMEDDNDLKSMRVKNNPPGNAFGRDEK